MSDRAELLERRADVLESLDRITDWLAADTREQAKRDQQRSTVMEQMVGLRRELVEIDAQLQSAEPEPDPTPVPAEPVDPLVPSERSAEALHRAVIDNSIAENKLLFVPGLRASRRPKTKRYTASQMHSDGKAPNVRDAIQDATGQKCIGRSIQRHPDGRPIAPGHEIALIENVEFGEARSWVAKPGKHIKWFSRTLNNRRFVIRDCDVTSPFDEASGRQKFLEHMSYEEVSESYEMIGCTAIGLGGHMAYQVNRPYPFQQYGAQNVQPTKPMLVRIDDSHAIDCDQDAVRSAFAFTMFNPGTFEAPATVVLQDSSAVCEWDFYRAQSTNDKAEPGSPDVARLYNPGRAAGMFVIQHYDIRKHRAYSQRHSHPTQSVRLTRFLGDYAASPMPLGAIRGAKSVLIEDSAFRTSRGSRLPFIEIDDRKEIRDVCAVESVEVRNTLLMNMHVRVHLPGRNPIVFPGDLRHRRAIWRPGMSEPSVTAYESEV